MKALQYLVVVALYFVLLPTGLRAIRQASASPKTKTVLGVIWDSVLISATLIYVLGFSVGLVFVLCVVFGWKIIDACVRAR